MSISLNQYANIYSTFESERTRPVLDLLTHVPSQHLKSAIDLGCGPGNSTQVLVDLFPGVTIAGIDSSQDMINKAKVRLPEVNFDVVAIEAWAPTASYDLILANASLQWVPDHQQLYPRLLSYLNKSGILAIQTPDNLAEPAHCLIRDVATSDKWQGKLAGIERTPRPSADWYFQLLNDKCAQLTVWRTCYYHHLKGGIDDIIDWFRGSGLRPYLSRLDETEQQVFIDDYKAELKKAYPVMADGSVLLPFPRLFINATR